MRTLAASILLLAVGCNGGPKIDDTPNQTGEELNYVPGPYGYGKGSVIENLKFIAKWDPAGAAGTATYDQLPLKPLSLADFYNDKAVKYVVVSGNAGWCPPCNEEQKYVPGWQSKYEPKGFRFVQGLIQGYNARTGAPATEADINRWQGDHDIHVAVGLDPEGRIHQFADVAAFPLNMIVRTSDMQIIYSETGLRNLDATFASLP
jgi:thiol-disulfide isomerase/thioredoxin